MFTVCLLAMLLLSSCAISGDSSFIWKSQIRKELPRLGRSNWIVIGDASFPEHSRPGLRMIVTDGHIPDILNFVLKEMGRTEFVSKRLFSAQELGRVGNDDAPGVDEYRKSLNYVLNGREIHRVQQRTLDILMEDSRERFVTLVIKSVTDLPYTSIYLELDTGYWSADAEADLRKRIKNNLR